MSTQCTHVRQHMHTQVAIYAHGILSFCFIDASTIAGSPNIKCTSLAIYAIDCTL